MPRLSTWFIRLALAHLTLGFTLGAALLIYKAGALPPAVWIVLPAHQEMLLVGFMLQLVFGVGFWILPRPPRSRSDRPMWAALVLLNVGVWLALAGSLLPGMDWLAAAGRTAEMAAVLLFATNIWPRVRSFREVKG